MNVMPPHWIKWIDENIKLGSTPGAMIATLAQNSFAPDFSMKIIMERIAAASQTSQPQGAAQKIDETGSHNESAGKRIGNFVQLSDRRVEVLAHMEKPNITLYGNVLSKEECQQLIDLAQPKLKRSTLVDKDYGTLRADSARTSQGAAFKRNENPFITMLDRRIAELMRLPVENGEGLQILRYGIGGEYQPHYDYFPPHLAGSAAHIAHGQRVATLILYLNEVEEGGETVFPKIDFSVVPRPGNALFFSYFNAEREVDPLTYHAGAPVIKGEKWIATRWMREREFKFAK